MLGSGYLDGSGLVMTETQPMSRRGRNCITRSGLATSANHASQSPHPSRGSPQVAPPSRLKNSSLSPQPKYSAGASPPNSPAMFTGSSVASPSGRFQLSPPSSLHCTPPSFAIQIVPPMNCCRTALWSNGGSTPVAACSVISKSAVKAIPCGSTCTKCLRPRTCPVEMSRPSSRCQEFAPVGIPDETCTWLLSEKNTRNPALVAFATTKMLPLGVVSASIGGPGSNVHCAVPVASNWLKSPRHRLASPASRSQVVLQSVPLSTPFV